jgi:type II secretory pathway component PulC
MPEYCVQETKEGDYSMRQPFWKLNFGLLLVVLALLCVVLFDKIHLPHPTPIAPSEGQLQTITQKVESVDVSKICLHDLFNTYISRTVPEQEKTDYVKPAPPPPEAIVITPPPVEQPQFLDPLPLTLTGVFMFNDETKDRAVILNTKTNEEATYKIGDEIEDAQLVKIFSQKVLFVRSNGQQEVIYLSQDIANNEMKKNFKTTWDHISKKIDSNHYVIDKQEFINEITTISNLIDRFNLATAYKQGKSIGIKIGSLEENGLASAFGFNSGDIVTHVNHEPVATTNERMDVFKKLKDLPNSGTITIEFLRNEQPTTLTLTLGTIVPSQQSVSKQEPKNVTLQKERETREQQLALLKQREQFAPTAREIRFKERENVIRHQRALESRRPHTRTST